MIRIRHEIPLAMLFGGAIGVAPANAMTRQSAISPGSGAPSTLVDPDERADRLVDQSQWAASQGHYDRENTASVVQFGNAGSAVYGPPR